MKASRILYSFALLTCAVLIMGCPYSSEIALSEATIKASDNMIGTWEESGNESVNIEIKRADGNKLEIIQTTKGEEGSEPTIETYAGHLTDINGTLFLNLEEKTEYSSTFYFYKIVKDGEFKLVVYSVTPNIREKFENSADMKKFFAENMKNSYFYESTESTYHKIK